MRLLLLLVLLLGAASARAADRMLFWNLTTSTITSLTLAPAGTTGFGPNQCVNDRDGSVDHDERLPITGVQPGRYDVRLADKRGRSCLVRGVEVKGTGRVAFSLADGDLTDCSR